MSKHHHHHHHSHHKKSDDEKRTISHCDTKSKTCMPCKKPSAQLITPAYITNNPTHALHYKHLLRNQLKK